MTFAKAASDKDKSGRSSSPDGPNAVSDSDPGAIPVHQSGSLKRILLVMSQPPGNSGVQALVYNKLLPFVEAHGWEFHFAGPDPSIASVLTEMVPCPSKRLHYSGRVSWSRRFAVLKNRRKRFSPSYGLFLMLQVLAKVVEKLLRHDSDAYQLSGVCDVVMAAEAETGFSLIAGKSPDFRILDAASRLASILDKPCVAMLDDPHGLRSGAAFHPYDAERQKQVLDQCCGSVFMSAATSRLYVDCGLVATSKVYQLTDSYPSFSSYYCNQAYSSSGEVSSASCVPARPDSLSLLHLGNLPVWRPVDTLMDAVEMYDDRISVDIYGYLYPKAHSRIRASSCLQTRMHVHASVHYLESHRLAAKCVAQLVVIGPHHLDNQPSKFFEYLGHRKPVLVVGPPGNPLEALVRRLGIGVFADVRNPHEMCTAMACLQRDYQAMVDAYEVNRKLIEEYAAVNVAAHLCTALDQMLAASGNS